MVVYFSLVGAGSKITSMSMGKGMSMSMGMSMTFLSVLLQFDTGT
jgi:hypothetical protein